MERAHDSVMAVQQRSEGGTVLRIAGDRRDAVRHGNAIRVPGDRRDPMIARRQFRRASHSAIMRSYAFTAW